MELCRNIFNSRLFTEEAVAKKCERVRDAMTCVLAALDDEGLPGEMLSGAEMVASDCEAHLDAFPRELDISGEITPCERRREWLRTAKSSHVAFRASEFADENASARAHELAPQYGAAMEALLRALVLPELSADCDLVRICKEVTEILNKEWEGSPLGEVFSIIVSNLVKKLERYGIETECAEGVGLDTFCVVLDMLEWVRDTIGEHDHSWRVRVLFECDQLIAACMQVLDLESAAGAASEGMELAVASARDDPITNMLLRYLYSVDDPSTLMLKGDPSKAQSLKVVRQMCVSLRARLQSLARGLLTE
jgi:hypothetical protein